jgi:hypothetical protein
MWGGEAWDMQGIYPDYSRLAEISNANPGLRSSKQWTQSCVDSPSAAAGTAQLTCSADSDCNPVGGGVGLQCVFGVCVLNRQDTATCYSHRDCLALNKMCSGNGKCVDSILQVENDLERQDVEFELYAEECSATDESLHPTVKYDTYGASPWETIPDVLEMYGMCSYENWFEYLEFVDPSNSARANVGLCGGQSDAKGCLPMASDAAVSR